MSTDMAFKALLDDWAAGKKPVRTRSAYAIRLTLEDAARIHALSDMFEGVDQERIITDLLSTALDRIEAAFPYVPGDKVIREDDHGDPIYEDVGLTPRFLALVRQHQQALETED